MDAEIEREAERLYGFLQHCSQQDGRYSRHDCVALAPKTLRINKLKKETGAVILAHSYTDPEIVYGVADYAGDSYYLSECAKKSNANKIIFAGVVFMAETAKILNPRAEVVVVDETAGCSLADDFSAQELAELKNKYPSAAVVCYINSSTEVKAISDVCVTSSVVYDIVANIPNKQIIFVPDALMADNIRLDLIRRGIDKEIISACATCCVHDRFRKKDVAELKQKYPDAKVISHPECRTEVTLLSDCVASTGGMMKYVKNSPAKTFIVLTEQGLINRMEIENPDKIFVGKFSICRSMKKNTLDKIIQSLISPEQGQIVNIDEGARVKAEKSILGMFEYSNDNNKCR